MNNIAVGFEAHVAAITEMFKASYVWADKDKSRVAMYVTDALAGISEVNQAYVAFALREAFIRKARRSSSVLAGTRFLGVQINRKKGSAVSVQLRNNDIEAKTIPARSVFQINGLDFYSVDSVIIEPKTVRVMTLRQGTPSVKTFDLQSIDLDFPSVKLSEPGFSVSADDLRVYTENKSTRVRTRYEKLEDSLFEVNTPDKIFIDSTDADGDCDLLFGNGVFGARLPRNDTLIVEYIRTTGTLSNIGQVGLRVSFSDRLISGITLDAAVGGDGEQDVNVLKMYAPYMFEAHKAWVRPSHWDGGIRNYPDVADVVIQSQRDIDPEDPMWMNTVRICILPKNSSSWGGANPNPRSAQWERFLAFVKEHTLGNLRVQTCNPEKILTDIVVAAYIFEDQSRDVWQSRIEKDLADFFRRRTGTLGRMLDPSDLHDLCKLDDKGLRREGLDYVRILAPTTPVVPGTSLEYVAPRKVTVQIKYTDRKEL